MLSARLCGDCAEAGRAVPLRLRRARPLRRADQGQRVAGAMVKDGGVERGLEAVLAEAERVRAVRLHRDRAGSPEADASCAAASARSRKRTTSSRSPRRTSTCATSSSARRCRRSTTSTGWSRASSRTSRSTRSTGWRRSGIPRRNRLVIVSAPEKAGRGRPRRGGALGRGAEGRRRQEPRPPTSTRVASTALLETVPDAARRSCRPRPRGRVGITEWELANGVKVVLKPTTLPAGRNPVPRVQPRRHVARERRRLHPGQHGHAGGRGGRPRQASAARTCARC